MSVYAKWSHVLPRTIFPGSDVGFKEAEPDNNTKDSQKGYNSPYFKVELNR